jgi:hypothetical protein
MPDRAYDIKNHISRKIIKEISFKRVFIVYILCITLTERKIFGSRHFCDDYFPFFMFI